MKTYRFKLGLFLLVFLTTNSCKEDRSPILNLDFEKVDLQTKKALGWRYYEYGYKASLDKEVVNLGTYSLKIESISDKYSIYNGAVVCIIFDSIPKNQKIKLSGLIKNEGTNRDTLGLFISYNSPTYNLGRDLVSKNFVGSHEWQEYSIEILPEGQPDNIMFGIRMKGTGKIWIDNLKLFMDDKQILKFPIQNSFKANKNELKWLKNHSIHVKTVHAESGFEDLEPLKESFKDARIVALGENSHGTSEIFEMKHRLLEFLSSEMGFNIFSIESGMFNTDPLNDYILTGSGDPKKLMPAITPAWRTQEVLDMINWMKKFNERGSKKIQFKGFDMQSFDGPLYHLSTYAKDKDQSLTPFIDSLSIMLYNSPESNNEIEIKKQNILKIKKCDQLLSYLKNTKNKTDNNKDGIELNVIIQNANIIRQYLDYFSNGHPSSMRDRYMAENVSWILDNNPNAKVVLWAHNEHISKQPYMMGEYLSKKYGKQYYSIGFLTNEGKYTAGIENIISTDNKLIKGKPGSFEYNFNKTGLPCFFFDLKSINKNEPNSLWLDKRLNQRIIGGDATDDQFFPALLRKKFDAIIFINSTSPTKTFLPTNVKFIP